MFLHRNPVRFAEIEANDVPVGLLFAVQARFGSIAISDSVRDTQPGAVSRSAMIQEQPAANLGKGLQHRKRVVASAMRQPE